MTGLEEIVRGVAGAIAGKYVVYRDAPLQVDSEIERYVVVTAVPIADSHDGPLRADRTVLVDVANAGDGAVTQTEYMQFVWDCDAAFRPVFAFAGRKIMPAQISSNITDGVAHYMFRLEFLDALDRETGDVQVMETMENRRI